MWSHLLTPAALATDLFQYLANNGITSFDVSSGFISHKSLCSNGLRYPFQANLSNQAKNNFEIKLDSVSGQGFYTKNND